MTQATISHSSLLTENIPLVISIARRFRIYKGCTRQDYISVGVIGLIKCLETYDADKGKIAAYAGRSIRWEIVRLIQQVKKWSEKEIRLTSKSEAYLAYEDCPGIEESFPPSLTKREEKVLRLFSEGYTAREIATKLSATRTTIYKVLNKAKKKIKDAEKANTISK